MPNPDKVGAVAEITGRFNRSSAVVLTDYRGLTVAQLKELRTSLGATSTYAVVKNTLTKRAVSAVGYDDLAPLLIGPTAIAFIEGEPVEAAKALRNFSRTNPLLIIKGGVLDGKMLSTAEINSLADLESREVLLGRLAGGMKASLNKAAALFQAPLSQVARLAAALAEKKPAEDAPAEAAPEAPPVDVSPTPETADDSAAAGNPLTTES
ncbi:MAG: 50S ribosomal protein L10 [Geodermatophilaceae bacterium]|nr:50S ribosomal protein L10 [Geodermatophilaceae bacterium]